MPIRDTASIISGMPGHDVEDVKLSGIRILYRGGLTLDHVAKQPADLVNTFFFRASGGVPPREPYDTPEREKEYPEPSMFGMVPAYGFFIRHASGIELNDVDVGYLKEDRRPAFVLDSVDGIELENCKAQKANGVPTLVMMKAKGVKRTIAPGWRTFEPTAWPARRCNGRLMTKTGHSNQNPGMHATRRCKSCRNSARSATPIAVRC